MTMPKGPPSNNPRNGMIALSLVIAMILLLGILALAFHQIGGDVRRQIHIASIGERALTMARGSIDEAISDFERQLNTTGSPLPRDQQLSRIIRTQKVGFPYSYAFNPKLIPQTTEMKPKISPVDVVFQRFLEAPARPKGVDLQKIPKEDQERIKKGFEEYFRTGYCGPDMDVAFSYDSPSQAFDTTVGMAAFKSKVSIPTDRADVVRELEVRRSITHEIHTFTGTGALLAALGIRPPQGRSDLFGYVSADFGGDDTTITSDDVHIGPFDVVRIVWRKDEVSSW